jgi:hypothetical protein
MQQVPGYRLGEILGQGGFGTVYRAEQLSVRREVALKVDNRVLATERDQRRFMREVTAAGRLSGHPHVVAVYDAGVLDDGRPYMVMELCPGGSLGDRLTAQGPFPVAEVRDIGVKIGDALAAAHGSGVLHRDLKPANLMINQYGMVALADFGLAASQGMESSATRNALTPAYAPPEAFHHEEPSVLGDVYSLAATLYALLQGRPPRFPATGSPTIMQLVAAQLQPLPPLAHVPPAFNDLLRQAMAYERSDRPQSIAAFRDALAALYLETTAAPRVHGTSGAAPAQFRGPLTATGPSAPQAYPPYASGAAAPQLHVPLTSQAHAPFATDEAYRALATTDRGGALRGQAPTAGPGGTQGGAGVSTVWGDSRGGRSGRSTGSRVGLAALVVGCLALGGVGVMALGPGFGGKSDPQVRSSGSPTAPQGGSSATSGLSGTGTIDGIDFTTEACAAAQVRGAHAACTIKAECWNGLNVNAGDMTARNLPCDGPHTFETFAVGVLPVGLTWDAIEAGKNSRIRRVCNQKVLTASREGAGRGIGPSLWAQPEVMPPSKAAYERGFRAYRCLAGLDAGLDALTQPAFH